MLRRCHDLGNTRRSCSSAACGWYSSPAARVDSAVAAGLVRGLTVERAPADALIAAVDQLGVALRAGGGGEHLPVADGADGDG